MSTTDINKATVTTKRSFSHPEAPQEAGVKGGRYSVVLNGSHLDHLHDGRQWWVVATRPAHSDALTKAVA